LRAEHVLVFEAPVGYFDAEYNGWAMGSNLSTVAWAYPKSKHLSPQPQRFHFKYSALESIFLDQVLQILMISTNKSGFTLLILLWFRTFSPSSSLPNIIILLADNLGYNDISLFGAPSTNTPNVDRIGQQGVQFKNWNSAAHLCSASRAALLTGKYPVRTGIYPGVFHADSVYGLLPSETTLAEYLRDLGYATSIVGKWHLGHNTDFLPTNQGFDEWLGLPYHASGGSVEDHVCQFDRNENMWLPLYDNHRIVQQPVNMHHLAQTYTDRAIDFIQRHQQEPFFLYFPFSHVHQLCAPRDYPEQFTCQWSARDNSTFVNAVEEMDWMVGKVLDTIDQLRITNNTLVLFTSDNGPWVAEQQCSGSKGPFLGQW
jgi:arylsulfatase